MAGWNMNYSDIYFLWKNGKVYKPFAQVFVNFCWGDSLHQLIPLYLEKIEVKGCEKHSFLRKLEHTPDPELAVYVLKILSLVEFWGYLGWSVGFF